MHIEQRTTASMSLDLNAATLTPLTPLEVNCIANTQNLYELRDLATAQVPQYTNP